MKISDNEINKNYIFTFSIIKKPNFSINLSSNSNTCLMLNDRVKKESFLVVVSSVWCIGSEVQFTIIKLIHFWQ